MSRELRNVIINFITLLRPFGGKIYIKTDFAFMSPDINELCKDTLIFNYN